MAKKTTAGDILRELEKKREKAEANLSKAHTALDLIEQEIEDVKAIADRIEG